MKLVIVSTFWNAEKFIEECINSLKNQYYTNYIAYFIDDMSTDNSYEIAKNTIDGDERFRLVKNDTKKYKSKNFVETIINNSEIEWDDVIVELDGDDMLKDNAVLGLINKVFSNQDIWICGSRWVDKKGRSMKYGKSDADNPRKSTWNFSHMRTYRAFLFRLIDLHDLQYEGEYVRAAVDLAIGIPMLEMSGNEHYYFLDEVTYVYNWHDHQSYSNQGAVGDSKLQGKTAKHIYSLPRYKKVILIYDKIEFSIQDINIEHRKTSLELLNEVLVEPLNLQKKVVNDTIQYDFINKILKNKNVYVPTKEKPLPIQNKPVNRNELVQLKKDSVVAQTKRNMGVRQTLKNMAPHVFGGKNRQ
jgi:glycosyltransferase involved in cell wall biosynthesis